MNEKNTLTQGGLGKPPTLERLACKQGRNDEAPNIELAEKLCADMDARGVCEVAAGLKSSDTAIVNDCIKVLYEVGQRKPELIADFADDFVSALSGKNNRLVWGSMTALVYIATQKAEVLWKRFPEIFAAYQKGSVITVDNAVSVFANMCRAGEPYRTQIFPLLTAHLAACRAKEVAQHAERISVCVDADNRDEFIAVLTARTGELSAAQNARLTRVIKAAER